jgi:hypothetical protein
MNAYREWDVEVWDMESLGLEAQDLTPLIVERAQSFPPPWETGEVFQGEPAAVADDAIAALRQHRLVG